MPFDRTMFNQYESQLKEHVPSKPLPPEGVRVWTLSNLCARPLEGMVVHTKSRQGLRWRIFGYKGTVASYPHRGWEPMRWWFKDEA